MIHKFPVNPKLRTIYVNLVLQSPGKSVSSQLSSGRIAESVLALTHAELLRRYNFLNYLSQTLSQTY